MNGEVLTGIGLAYMDDKDEERFGQALPQRASPGDKQNRRVSSLCARAVGVSFLITPLDKNTTRLQDADLCYHCSQSQSFQ